MRHIDPTASEYITSGYLARSRPGGQMYDPSSILGAGASVVGGLIGSDASEDAAEMQQASAREANALQEKMFNKQIELQEPWRQAGMGGLNRLSYLLGLSPTGYGGGTTGANSPESEASIRARLEPKFMTTNTAAPLQPYFDPQMGWYQPPGGTGTQATTTLDKAKFEQAVQRELQNQRAAQARIDAQGAKRAKTDPLYGSLLDKFSMDDFEQDPGYQFRMDEGMKALERSAAARGGLFSGRAMKDTLRFGQGLGSQEYGAAFDRFNVQNTNTFNRLASIAGVGQTAANQTGAAAANYGAQAGGNIIGAGNAGAAGRVGSANSIMGGIGQGISSYQMNSLLNRGGGGNSWMPQTSGLGYGGSSFGGGGLMDYMKGYGVF